MPSLVRQFLQFRLRAPSPSPDCPRGVCKRFRRCVPPADAAHDGLPTCPFMPWMELKEWEARLPDMLQPVEDLLRSHPNTEALWRSGKLAEEAERERAPLTRRQRRRLPWYIPLTPAPPRARPPRERP